MGKIAVVFPGQGSQVLGMGKEFHDASPQARELFERAEAASGLDLKRLCFEGPMDELTRTVNLQPAMATVDLVCWQALAQAGIKPDYAAGHSLGEYPALAAGEALELEDCLKLVALRGKLMDRDAQARPGAMAAVMGASPEEVAGICEQAGGQVQPANYNTPVQTVITGESQAVAQASALAQEKGLKVIPLKVSGAWHSPLMADAARDMAQALADVQFSQPRFMIAPNTTGLPTDDPAKIKDELGKQLISPVRWVQTVLGLCESGVDTFIEAGPKNVLAGLIKKTAPKGVNVLNLQGPADLERVTQAVA